MRLDICVGGSGGQGVLLFGTTVIRAAVHEGKRAMCLPSYGAEARGYRLPVFTSGGASDAKVFDTQAAAEAALSLFAAAAGGADLIQNVGYLDSALTGSLELMALGDEIAGWLRRYLREIEVSEETLCLSLIHEVGPDGDFLAAEDTVARVREDWVPGLFDRQSLEKWSEQGATTLEQRARARVREIVREHRSDPLPARVRAALASLAGE